MVSLGGSFTLEKNIESDVVFGFRDVKDFSVEDPEPSGEEDLLGSSRDSEGKPRALGGGEEIGVLDLEAWIQGLIAEGKFTNRACLEVLQAVVGELPVAKRPVLHGQGRAVLCGLYAVGGFRGVSVFTDKSPRVVEFLNRFFRSRVPDGVWTTLYV